MPKTDKLSKQIQRIASQIILYDLNDPRIKLVTVTRVKLSGDYRYCTICVSILGTKAEQRTTMRGLQHAQRFIQKQLFAKLSLRQAPIVTIEFDQAIEKTFEAYQRLQQEGVNDTLPLDDQQ